MTTEQKSNHCGSKPKKIAIGIAPLGTISIGIVPMGVVCIGVVPMGVISIGVVAMGIINASIVGMGILSLGVSTMGVFTAGPISMGLIDLRSGKSHNHHQHINDLSNIKNTNAYETKKDALLQADKLGCEGVHKMGDYWMPCNKH